MTYRSYSICIRDWISWLWVTSSGKIFAVSAQNDSDMLFPRQWISIGDNHFEAIWYLHQVMKGQTFPGCNGKTVTKGDQNKISSVGKHVGAMSNMGLLPLLLLTGLVSSSEPALRATQVGVSECSWAGPRFSAGLPTKTLTTPPFYTARIWKEPENNTENQLLDFLNSQPTQPSVPPLEIRGY